MKEICLKESEIKSGHDSPSTTSNSVLISHSPADFPVFLSHNLPPSLMSALISTSVASLSISLLRAHSISHRKTFPLLFFHQLVRKLLAKLSSRFVPPASFSSICLIVSVSPPRGMSQQSPLPIMLLSKWGLPPALQSVHFKGCRLSHTKTKASSIKS